MSHTYKEIAEYCQSIYQGKRLLITPYAYQVTFANLLTNGTRQTGNLNITANADFVLTEMLFDACLFSNQYAPASGDIAYPVTLLITDSGTNEQFTSAAIDINTFASNGLSKRDLPFPRWIEGKSNLSIEAQCFSSSSPNGIERLDVVFSGVLVRAYTG